MSDAKIKEAWFEANLVRVDQQEGVFVPWYHERLIIVLDAYVQAEARARKLEFEIEHDWHTADECDGYAEYHKRTVEDWEAIVRKELSE